MFEDNVVNHSPINPLWKSTGSKTVQRFFFFNLIQYLRGLSHLIVLELFFPIQFVPWCGSLQARTQSRPNTRSINGCLTATIWWNPRSIITLYFWNILWVAAHLWAHPMQISGEGYTMEQRLGLCVSNKLVDQSGPEYDCTSHTFNAFIV